MGNFIGLVYATLKNEGIDTKDMSTDEAVKKYNELQEKAGGKAGEKEGTPAEQKRLKEIGVNEEKDITIPDWFLINNLSEQKRYAFSVGEKSIEKETEKAALIKVASDYGDFNFWVPKSVLNNAYKTKQEYTYVTIGGKEYAKEILLKRPFMLKKLGITKEELEKM